MTEVRPERWTGVNAPEACRRLAAEAERLRLEIGTLEAYGLNDAQTDSLGELSAYDNHPADLGTELFERSKDIALRDNLRLRLKQVEHAQQRVREGTYGRCEGCGRLIDPARLAAQPEATRCLDCQKERDAIERNAVDKQQQGYPVEEEVLEMSFGNLRGPDRENAFDREDSWQKVARFGTANSPQDEPDAVNYDETFYHADEDLGLVEETDAIIDPSQGGIESGELTDEFYALGRRGQKRRPHAAEFIGTEP